MRRRLAEIAVGLALVCVAVLLLPGLAQIFAYVALALGSVAFLRAGLNPASLSIRSIATAVFLTGAMVWPLAKPMDLDTPASETCDTLLNSQERALAHLFETDRDQRHRGPHCDALLTRVARSRAVDMASRGYFSHVTPDGDGPNRQVVKAGYRLPAFYGRRRNANNVEVITAGDETAGEAWRSWLKSRGHRRQVLGLTRFFADQTDYGVGYATDPRSRYVHYWVLITARHE